MEVIFELRNSMLEYSEMEFASDFFVIANNRDSFSNDVVQCLMSDFIVSNIYVSLTLS